MSLLVRIFRQPGEARRLNACDWDLLVRQARHANLLGRLHHRLHAAGVAAEVPRRPANHFLSGAVMAGQQHHSIRREVGHLRDALSEIGLPLILLKGAAYVAAGLPAGLEVEVCVEVASPDDRQTFLSPAMPHVRWLEATSVPGAALSWALMNQRPSSAPGYVWMAGESGAMRALRGYYLQSLGLASDRVSAKGYWKVGEAAHRGA